MSRDPSQSSAAIIRKALATDAEQIWKVHTSSIRRFCAGAYTPEQIEEWTAALAPDRYLDAISTLESVVVEVDGQVRGFCFLDLEAGEVHAIYLAPAAAGRGFGRQLMAWAEATALQHGWTELLVKATLNAVPFYEKCGFESRCTANHPLPSGTPRACTEMRKSLGQGAAARR